MLWIGNAVRSRGSDAPIPHAPEAKMMKLHKVTNSHKLLLLRTHDATPPHLDVFPASGKLQRFAWVFAGHVQQNASKRPSKRPQKCVQDAPLGVLGPPTWPILHPRQKKIEKILKMVSQMETFLALGAPFRSLGPPLGGPRGENMVSKVNFMHIVKTSIFTSVFACF